MAGITTLHIRTGAVQVRIPHNSILYSCVGLFLYAWRKFLSTELERPLCFHAPTTTTLFPCSYPSKLAPRPPVLLPLYLLFLFHSNSIHN